MITQTAIYEIQIGYNRMCNDKYIANYIQRHILHCGIACIIYVSRWQDNEIIDMATGVAQVKANSRKMICSHLLPCNWCISASYSFNIVCLTTGPSELYHMKILALLRPGRILV